MLDCLQWIEIAIRQLNDNKEQSTDESETERSSEERNNESDNNSTDVCRNKSSYDLETGKTIECPYDDKTEISMLLCTCTELPSCSLYKDTNTKLDTLYFIRLELNIEKIMGLCFCSLGKVGSVSIEGSHQTLDRKETYNDLTTYLKESHEEVDKLQQNFAQKVIQSPRVIKIVRKKVEKELIKSKETKPLSKKKAEEIVKDVQKENDWLKRSKEIVTNVITKLKDAREDDPSFIDELPNYQKLIDKLKTDVMTLIESRIKHIKNQPSCAFVAAESSDDSETDGPSNHAKSGNDSSHSVECVSENESNYGDETVDKSDRYHKAGARL
ncbi:unnamed protein product [Mytilus coruscus]|uniref:Uncharacterized protein n=1 Tax=Mytilus coruscus TaxID=42192 RepID=A0A6J8DCJ4_MYTCO|nr:unnamed protein product [Mytilus coruscus]